MVLFRIFHINGRFFLKGKILRIFLFRLANYGKILFIGSPYLFSYRGRLHMLFSPINNFITAFKIVWPFFYYRIFFNLCTGLPSALAHLLLVSHSFKSSINRNFSPKKSVNSKTRSFFGELEH